MALPLLLIFHAGRIIPIVIGVGTALARFIAKNPRVVGSVLSIEAISSAIQSFTTTEKEKIDIVNEIGKENPRLKADLLKNVFYPDTNLIFNIAPYLLVALIIYLILRK